jgi:hypothetical protein
VLGFAMFVGGITAHVDEPYADGAEFQILRRRPL